MARRDRTVPLQVTRSARILVIEDHTDTRHLCTEFLIGSSANGGEAFAVAASLALDAAVVDLSVDLRLVRELAACAPSGGIAGGYFVALRAESCQRRA
jgi:hypothetical protein